MTRKARTQPGACKAFLTALVGTSCDECIPWPFNRTKGGYPTMMVGGTSTTATRVMLELVEGPPPFPDAHAAHAPLVCRNPSCVNPMHLRWATPAENIADKLLDGTHGQGEQNAAAILTEKDIRSIRNDSRTHRAIAESYGVSRVCITDIKNRRNWSHLP